MTETAKTQPSRQPRSSEPPRIYKAPHAPDDPGPETEDPNEPVAPLRPYGA